ncbi:heterodisulfide reductase-related iron-sulfur binding cluster [Nocardioides bruguierae]|uniref:Heterodisulfide reductase-related iron-sulfur binding cluster n=1 Tax=Nocardioides bruguierae TaxID=2945102 RepID=A0A9X2IE12_9ACTN|nr:heterodisulfide reductase-related iron-sulfur binding cluster [Nocardioides bruguierae]MCM0620346.1 heterodisulfide reductase-related iron-sulfur binding cluster [Nocardioides bruguierae]
MQTFAIVVALALTVVTVVVVARAVSRMVATIRIGQATTGRTDEPGKRTVTLLKESVLHTRMLQWHWVGIMHWFVYAGFIVLSGAVATGFVQLFDPHFVLPLIGHFFLYEWLNEALGVLSTIGIVFLIVYRQKHHPRSLGRRSRFFGSTAWQAYFVEVMALLEGAAILFIRGAEYNLGQAEGEHLEDFSRFHFPVSSYVGDALFAQGPDAVGTLENTVIVIALIKVVLALVWLLVIASNLTMGVAWHRFTAWFNIWFKREAVGRDTDGATTALGGLKPMTANGKALTLEDLEEMDEETALGVGKVEDFSWKGILDFTTCTECGRCQSQCPAWNTEKPLSPKLFITAMRDHAYAKAPYLLADESEREAMLAADPELAREVEKALVGETGGTFEGHETSTEGGDWFYNPPGMDAVIDPEVLWNCTSCGACVQQCPVDIEHVDHIVDMRRYQVLVESNFPPELNGLFKGLEGKGNPWNMSAQGRLDWAKDLPFDVQVVGDTIESLDEVDWLFWVGCAGAYEDRAKKTTRAVAELLDMAGVSFGVLGNGETCTGDPARRAGNEFVFQGLAAQNVETFKEYRVKKVVSTCAHCFNTLKNEYKDFGIELEVVHHTQLLNRLVREGKLTPVGGGAATQKRSITYHDPCYIGRHNGVYEPPRELLQVLPGTEFKEMPRNSEKSFCCGAGGARMWMEEKTGSRINLNRTTEAVETGADQIAVGCPFCRVMLSDGLTAKQAAGEAREEVEVLDVAQMLLASVKGDTPAPVAAAATAAAPAAPVEERAEPAPGDVTATASTVTETQDVGPAAKASGGDSLFDVPDDASSLFDTPADSAPPAPPTEDSAPVVEDSAPPAAPVVEERGAPATSHETPAPEAPTSTEAHQPRTDVDIDALDSLFDVEAPEPTTVTAAAAAPAAAPLVEDSARSVEDAAPVAEDPTPVVEVRGAPATSHETPAPEAPTSTEAHTPRTDVDIDALDSLFDVEAPEPTSVTGTAATPTAPPVENSAPSADPAVEDPTPVVEDSAPMVEDPTPVVEERGAPATSHETPAPEAPSPTPAAATAPTSTEAHTPHTDVDIDALDSLFDVEAPEPTSVTAAAAAPLAPPAEEPTPAVEDTGSSVEEPTPAVEDSAPMVEEVAQQPSRDPEPTPAPVAATAPASTSVEAHTPHTGVDIDALESLFDVEAPEPTTVTAAAAAPAAAPVEDSAPAVEEIAQQPSRDPEPTPTDEPTDEPESEPETESAQQEQQPAASEPTPAAPVDASEAHQPRTDVDIDALDSLFDI